jgi:hypothetical protein
LVRLFKLRRIRRRTEPLNGRLQNSWTNWGRLQPTGHRPRHHGARRASAAGHAAHRTGRSTLFAMGPAGVALGTGYVLGQIYYRDNLAALSAVYDRALVLAPAAITDATGFGDLGKLLDVVLKGLLAALIGLGATTALGATIGGIVGFFFGGAGAAPGAVAGAKVGFDVGVAVLTWLGLGFLVVSIGQGLGELAAMLTLGIRRAWEAGNNKNEGARATEIEWAARDLAKAIGVLIRLILEGILAYLMRGAPMATARTATGTIGRVRAGESGAVAAETVAEVVKSLRESKLGKGFADWIELNWQKLLENPKLRRSRAATAPASGGSSGEAQTPSQALKKQAEEPAASKASPASKEPGPKFSSSIDDGTKRALADFPKTDAAKIAKELDGKTLSEVKTHMDAYSGSQKSVSNLPSPPGQQAQVVQTKWELPDGTVVRAKETVPPGGNVDKWRQEPSLSISVLKRDINGNPLPEAYANEAFKVSSSGVPVPKGPNEVDTTGLSTEAAKKAIDAAMNAGHQSIAR